MRTSKNRWNQTRISRSQRRDLRKQFLLFVEGKKTEVNYFGKFSRTRVIPIDAQNLELVQQAIVKKGIEEARWGKLDTWCVIDIEGATGKNLEKIVAAIALGRKNNITVVFSNRAIEIWFYLHGGYSAKPTINIQECEDMVSSVLTKILGKKVVYQKNMPDIFYYLRNHIPTAIANAERLMRKNVNGNPGENPSTTVHMLVKELIRE